MTVTADRDRLELALSGHYFPSVKRTILWMYGVPKGLIPVEKQQAISDLRRAFPEYGTHPQGRSEFCTRSAEEIPDVHEFARFVTHLFAQDDQKRVQKAIDHVEKLFEAGGPELRSWAYSFLEALQDLAAWQPCGSDEFIRFLGSHTRQAWRALDAIRTDLGDCGTLESEVLLWRVVHRELPKAKIVRGA